MMKTNYYTIRINQFLKKRFVFLLYASILLFALTYKITTPVRTLEQIKFYKDLKYGNAINFSLNQEQYTNLIFISYIIIFIGYFAVSNILYEHFFIGIFTKKNVPKWYDVKKIPYPYDHSKLQIILGQVHNEDNVDLSLKPKYQKISGDGLFQNILITGTIGTGKTICTIAQIALQLIYLFYDNAQKKCAMLFLDVKGTFWQFVHAFALECGRWNDLITIELGGKYKYNPLHKPNLTEIELANRIRYILELFSSGGGSEAYWIEKAEATICELIKLIRIYNDGYVNFEELHKMGTKEEYRNEKVNLIHSWYENDGDGRSLNEEQKYNYITAKAYFDDEFNRLDEKGQGYIKSEITRMTGPFISTKIVKDTFCPSKEEINFYGFEDVIRKGLIVVWKINANKEPKVAKLMAAYLKLDYQKEIMISLEKKNSKEGKILAERVKVCVCDEYQEYCTKNDPDFFAQSREPRSITIAATQSYNSLKKSLQNDETITSVLLQSLVNKIWLRSDDVEYTIKKVIAQIDKVEKEKVTTGISEQSRTSKFSSTISKIVSNAKNISSTQNIQVVKENKFDVKFLNQDLSLGKSVCFLSDGKNILKPTVVHLISLAPLDKKENINSILFEGRIICKNNEITFTTDAKEIFENINKVAQIDLNTIENTTINPSNNDNAVLERISEEQKPKKTIRFVLDEGEEEKKSLSEEENDLSNVHIEDESECIVITEDKDDLLRDF